MNNYPIVLKGYETRDIFSSMDIADSTKRDYLARLPRFIAFAKNTTIDRDLLLRYKHELRDDATISVATKNKLLTAARIFLRELHRRGVIPSDLSIGVKSFRQTAGHKVVGLNYEEVERICAHLQSLNESFAASRLRVIVSLLLFQGLRQVEICRINIEDVDLANKRIYVVGKGHFDRQPIHTHPATQKALTDHLKLSQAKQGPLLTHINRQKSRKRLSTRGLRQIFQNLLQELDIQKTTHGARHYFTTELIKHFRSDLMTVAKFTRHSSIEMLQIYNDEVMHESKANELSLALNHRLK